jgi:tRNA(Ile2)-agmatinylcytidine synthase
LVTIEEAEKTASSIGAAIHKFKNGRGVIGALAALGFTGEKTFELIAYRSPLNYGKRRRINSASVYRMNDRLYPRVFDNLDAEKKRVLITPRGYDPIFCGIRGLTAEDVSAAWDMIEPLETIECTQVFETNQATDAHLKPKKIAEIRPYDCVIVSGGVSSQPKSLAGGHMVFVLSDETGSIDCAAYKPTGSFRTVISQLAEGDSVVAYGGIGKYPHTVNLEKIEVRSLTEVYSTEHPICCGRRMTSAGKDKGVKCRVCGSKSTAKKQVVERAITPGFYDVPAGSRRHLSKPLYLNEVISTGKAHRI